MYKYKAFLESKNEILLHTLRFQDCFCVSDLQGKHGLWGDLSLNPGITTGHVQYHGQLLDLLPSPGHERLLPNQKVTRNIKYDGECNFPSPVAQSVVDTQQTLVLFISMSCCHIFVATPHTQNLVPHLLLPFLFSDNSLFHGTIFPLFLSPPPSLI